MRSVRDTFLHFLADNLSGIPVHNVRRDPDRPDADKLQMNAVNVTFLRFAPSPIISMATVIIDVCNDDELTAVDWMKSIYDVLGAAYMTPVFDYSDPSAPVPTHTNVFWTWNSVKFAPVSSDFYTRYSLTMPLHFHLTH